MTNRRADGLMHARMDRPSYRDARTHLKIDPYPVNGIAYRETDRDTEAPLSEDIPAAAASTATPAIVTVAAAASAVFHCEK